MKYGLLIVFFGFGLTACSPAEETPQFLSSARAASPMEPLYPPLSADAVDGTVRDYE